ncbi:hypothetical protein [Spirosoma rhododendri]|uniref:NIPSNAP family containing protein n=1 Tax=Spirosoma rhododendri TaxID=2728024 RepID=A0A7L5DXC6_9BACT|nr:hypothetical protein [Spirosoma rhododendri]QJD80627.1 hypothetical protein HH216_21065 [Spirosoma rhododendri]
MQTNPTFRSLPALALALLFMATTAFGQAPKKMFSEVHYYKIKPSHTLTEARAFENEFKKVHQAQTNEGTIDGWYMLALNTTTNPNEEYNYITIKNFSDVDYMDNAYPEAALKKGWGNNYQEKVTELTKQSRELIELVKSEIWEIYDGASITPIPSPDKLPVWMIADAKVKNGQYEEYINQVKKLKPYMQERLNMGDGGVYTFAGLAFPWGSEKKYDMAWVIQMANRKSMIDDSNAEAAYKKAMPGVDRKQVLKELNNLADVVRQEEYHLMEYAVKAPTTEQAKK